MANCIQCGKTLLPTQRCVCPECFSKMPKQFHQEWRQATSEKGKLRVIRKVTKYVRMLQQNDGTKELADDVALGQARIRELEQERAA